MSYLVQQPPERPEQARQYRRVMQRYAIGVVLVLLAAWYSGAQWLDPSKNREITVADHGWLLLLGALWTLLLLVAACLSCMCREVNDHED
jgi:hypothetical protein